MTPTADVPNATADRATGPWRFRGKIWELALVLVTAVWGWTFVAIHDAVTTLHPSAFVAYRFTSAALIMAVALVPTLRRITAKEILGGMIAGCVLFAAYALQTAGLGSTTPSNAAFITGMSVVFTPLLLLAVFRVRPAGQQVCSIVLATAGLALVTLRGVQPHRGDILVLGCAMAFAVHIIVLSRTSPTSHAGRLTLVQLATVGLLGLGWAQTSGEIASPASTQTWIALIITALVASALAFLVQTKAQATAPPNRIVVILSLEPVFGGLFGYWLADDRFTTLNLLGAALIVTAMLVTDVRTSDPVVKTSTRHGVARSRRPDRPAPAMPGWRRPRARDGRRAGPRRRAR
ncbi:DMT family transporter [Amycolatopsis sp. CA-128772]|uniref:DMT family transporter n=1 Tax=Amycolatopsis sp. CA-128772 TaxID=2073159 RepID=UPI0011B02A2C|nr:DMT family transporter [Amycolatopsis sp. CA-128772]